MRIELRPDNGFYDWEDFKKELDSYKSRGWNIQIIAVLESYKFFIEKKSKYQEKLKKDSKEKSKGTGGKDE